MSIAAERTHRNAGSNVESPRKARQFAPIPSRSLSLSLDTREAHNKLASFDTTCIVFVIQFEDLS